MELKEALTIAVLFVCTVNALAVWDYYFGKWQITKAGLAAFCVMTTASGLLVAYLCWRFL